MHISAEQQQKNNVMLIFISTIFRILSTKSYAEVATDLINLWFIKLCDCEQAGERGRVIVNMPAAHGCMKP